MDMTETSGNRLIDSLARAVRMDLLRHSQLRRLERAEEIVTARTQFRALYFPTTAVCSILLGLRSGQRAETGTVGNEGFVGIPSVLGASTAEYVVVQVPGEAYEFPGEHFRRLVGEHNGLQQTMLQYVARAYALAKQSSLCIAYHSIGQRLARWLLAAQDRAGTNVFVMTQDQLSQMVAATRPRVGEAAGRLRAEGLIAYRRGTIEILDRSRLEQAACECYLATRDSRGPF